MAVKRLAVQVRDRHQRCRVEHVNHLVGNGLAGERKAFNPARREDPWLSRASHRAQGGLRVGDRKVEFYSVFGAVSCHLEGEHAIREADKLGEVGQLAGATSALRVETAAHCRGDEDMQRPLCAVRAGFRHQERLHVKRSLLFSQ